MLVGEQVYYAKFIIHSIHSYFNLRVSESICEFDWVVPLAGLLHLEFNVCKAFMKLNWEVKFEYFSIIFCVRRKRKK